MREFVDSFLVFSEKLMPLLHVVLVFILGIWVLRLIDSALKRIARIVPGDDAQSARVNHRTETLRHFVGSLGKVVLGVLIVLVLLNEMNLVETFAPLLAGAGIAGLAIGFGAQSLVKDVIAGFFVLLEDQYGVGESVRIGNQEGTVEEMTLRVTVLRSVDGEVHVIPNGSVQSVTVLSRDWRRALIDVEVSSKEDLGRVFGVLAGINDALTSGFAGAILDKPGIIGIERMTGTGVTIRLAARTHPGKHGDVTHEWRRRIKETFDREGISLAESPRVLP